MTRLTEEEEGEVTGQGLKDTEDEREQGQIEIWYGCEQVSE